jgi:uncharacterized caspase-like protein
MRLFASLFLFIVVCWGVPEAAAQEKRVALVVGNSGYQHTAVLKNPRADAEDMSAALKRLNFEVVEGIDLDKRAMERIIRQFGLKLQAADIALFFYAGHGLQVSGQNHLLPVDARLSTEGDIDFESIPLHLVLRQMEREAKTSLLLLDACRDNPLARNLARTMGTRSGQISQGLAEVKTGVGTLIGFSTQPGNVALDGVGRNSPYASALLKHVETPGRDISSTLITVRNEVVKATNGQQVPWEHTSLMGQVVFSAAAPSPQTGAANFDKEMEIAFWNAVKDSKAPEQLQAYIDRFPKGTFAGLARVLIDQAERENTTSREVSRREDELKRIEGARWSVEQQKRDAERKAAEAKHSAELDKARDEVKKAQAALQAAEKERETALKAAQSARLAQEDAKKAAEILVASLPKSQQPDPSSNSQTDNTALIRGIQKELSRVGCDPGEADGKWGPTVKGALEKFSRFAKAPLASDGPTQEALAVVAAKKIRVCPLECSIGEREIGGRCVAKTNPAKPAARAQGTADVPTPKASGSSFQTCIACCQNNGMQTGTESCRAMCNANDDRVRRCMR